MSDGNKLKPFTAEDFTNASQAIAAEKKAFAEANKKLAGKLTAARTLWDDKIRPSVPRCIETANRLIAARKTRFVQSEQAHAVSRDIQSAGYNGNLPEISIVERANFRNNKPAPNAPTVVIGLRSNGLFYIERKNFRQPVINYEAPSPIEERDIVAALLDYINFELLELSVTDAADNATNPSQAQQLSSSAEEPTTTSDVSFEALRPDIVKAIRANYGPITLASTAVIELIDERLDELLAQAPNSEERKEEHQKEVDKYSDLKAAVCALINSLESIKSASVPKDADAEATLSFSAGLRNWWNKANVEICERSFDSALFALGLTICQLAGAGAAISVVVPAVIIKGKPVVDALTKIGEKARQ